jgi:hypothetical protein
MADNGTLSRSWQVVAKELTEEKDPMKVFALSVELAETLKWDVHSSRRADLKATST